MCCRLPQPLDTGSLVPDDRQGPQIFTKSTKCMFPKSRPVFFEKQKSACARIIDHRVPGGTQKSMNIDNTHKIHAPTIQEECFLARKISSACGRIIDHVVLEGY